MTEKIKIQPVPMWMKLIKIRLLDEIQEDNLRRLQSIMILLGYPLLYKNHSLKGRYEIDFLPEDMVTILGLTTSIQTVPVYSMHKKDPLFIQFNGFTITE